MKITDSMYIVNGKDNHGREYIIIGNPTECILTDGRESLMFKVSQPEEVDDKYIQRSAESQTAAN